MTIRRKPSATALAPRDATDRAVAFALKRTVGNIVVTSIHHPHTIVGTIPGEFTAAVATSRFLTDSLERLRVLRAYVVRRLLFHSA